MSFSFVVNVQSDVQLPPGWKTLLRRAAVLALQQERVPAPAEIGLTVVDDEEMARLNEQYRGVAESTDVLSFPLFTPEELNMLRNSPESFPERPLLLGDVVVSAPTARRQAADYGHGLERELAYLFVHGVLHLLGHDHDDDDQTRRMRAAEETVLNEAGAVREREADRP